MSKSNTILLFVSDVAASLAYYGKILQQRPLEESPTFAFFLLPSGLGLALWQKEDVQPAPGQAGGGCDIGFKVEHPADVDRCFKDWSGHGATILMPPTDLEFGRSFVIADPDGHRLRVYALND